MFGAIAGAIGGALSSFASSALSSYLNENSARRMAEGDLARSKELAQWQALKLPSMQVQGLRDAGINPLVAYGNIGSASMPMVHNASPQHHYSNVGQALSELPERASALKTAEAQRDLLRAQADESRSRADNARLQTLMQYEQLHPSISLKEAQARYFIGQLPKQGGEQRLHFGLPFGIFSWDIKHPLGGILSSRSVQSARAHAQDLRDLRSVVPVDNGLDQFWMPYSVGPRKSTLPVGPRKSTYKRPGSLGH